VLSIVIGLLYFQVVKFIEVGVLEMEVIEVEVVEVVCLVILRKNKAPAIQSMIKTMIKIINPYFFKFFIVLIFQKNLKSFCFL
jgi:hypothetical protein